VEDIRLEDNAADAHPPLFRPSPSDSVAPSAATCSSCGAGSERQMGDGPSFVYAIGKVEPRFPSLSVEKEFVQATGRSDLAGLTDREALHGVLSQRQHRYLARQMCWVFAIEGIDTYLLVPRDPSDIDLLIESILPSSRLTDIDVVVGVRGPIAPPAMCNGLAIPIVIVDQIYSFSVDALIKGLPRPKDIPEKQFSATAEELFLRIMQMADNAGGTDDYRALNFLAVRYDRIYGLTAEAFGGNLGLGGVYARPSRLSGMRKIVDVIFSFTHRQTDVSEKYFVRVDVTEEFPFLVTKLTPYYVYDQNP
jgi:hypothetical protein